MILILAVFIGLAATLARASLKNRTLKRYHMRWEWLVFAAVLPQVLVFQIPAFAQRVPETIIPPFQIISMLVLLVFTFGNLMTPGFWAMTFGLGCNLLVILMNGGWMPIMPETLQRMAPSLPPGFWLPGTRLGITKDLILPAADTRLIFLSDIITFPQWFPYQVAFSIGDIFISIGVFLVLWSMSRKEEEQKCLQKTDQLLNPS